MRRQCVERLETRLGSLALYPPPHRLHWCKSMTLAVTQILQHLLLYPVQAEKRGVSSTVVGVIIGCSTLFAALLSPFSGYIVSCTGGSCIKLFGMDTQRANIHFLMGGDRASICMRNLRIKDMLGPGNLSLVEKLSSLQSINTKSIGVGLQSVSFVERCVLLLEGRSFHCSCAFIKMV